MIKKGKLLLIAFICIFFINMKTLAFKEYKAGDKVIFNDEEYYVISDSDSSKKYITLLKNKALTVDEIARFGSDSNGHLIVNSNFINLDDPEKVIFEYTDDIGGINYYSADDCSVTYKWNGSSYSYESTITSGCKNDYDDSDVKKVVDNWSSSFSDKLVKVDGYESRLIYLTELVNNFDYRIRNGSSYIYGENTPTFLLEENYPQWLIYSKEKNGNRLIRFNGRNIDRTNLTDSGAIRPVINLNKCALGDNDNYCQENSKDSSENIVEKHSETFKLGEMILYNGNFYYAIEESDESKDYVTLLKKEALTVDELYEYGKDENGNFFINSNTIDTANLNRKVYEYGSSSNLGGISYYSGKDCGAEYDGNNGGGNYYLDNVNINGCKNSYEISDVKKVVDNWAKPFSDDLVEVNGYKARLISTDDLSIYVLGFYTNTEAVSTFSDIKLETIFWALYSEESSYWTMSGVEDSNSEILLIDSIGRTFERPVINLAGVRPVINLKKCVLNNNCDQLKDDDNTSNPEIEEEPQQVNVDNTLKNMPGVFLVSVLVLISGIVIIAYNYNKSIKEKK